MEPSFDVWTITATQASFVRILPKDISLIHTQRKLPESFHSDPGDRLIAASALLHKLRLATFAERIKQSGAVTIWLPE